MKWGTEEPERLQQTPIPQTELNGAPDKNSKDQNNEEDLMADIPDEDVLQIEMPSDSEETKKLMSNKKTHNSSWLDDSAAADIKCVMEEE